MSPPARRGVGELCARLPAGGCPCVSTIRPYQSKPVFIDPAITHNHTVYMYCNSQSQSPTITESPTISRNIGNSNTDLLGFCVGL